MDARLLGFACVVGAPGEVMAVALKAPLFFGINGRQGGGWQRLTCQVSGAISIPSMRVRGGVARVYLQQTLELREAVADQAEAA